MWGHILRKSLVGGLSTALVTVVVSLHPATGFAATSALIVGTTYNPTPSTEYMQSARRYYLDPTTTCKVDTCPVTAVTTPEQLWPLYGDLKYDDSIAIGKDDLYTALLSELAANPTDDVVIYGTSQGAGVVTLTKRALADLPQADKDRVVLVVTGNPYRPNGGVMQRFAPLSVPVMDFTFGGSTPTDTGVKTIDISFQYDGVSDFPRYPLNPLVWLNSYAAGNIHSSYATSIDGYTEAELQQAINDPANRQTYGDTVYVTIPTKTLPLAQLIRDWGAAQGLSTVTTPLADLLEPTLRILVELSYDRTTPYGQPAPIGLFPIVNPVKLVTDLAQAARDGIKAAAADLRTNPPRFDPPSTGKATGGSARQTMTPAAAQRRASSAAADSRQVAAPRAATAVSNAADHRTASAALGAAKKARGGPHRAAHSR